jgi:branched-chain amino acid transport system substrate-binding protein
MACLLCLAGCSAGTSVAAPAGEIHIGVELPLTGPEGITGAQALNGIRFFAQQHPTLDGFDVKLRPVDDAGGGPPNPALGAANVQKLIADPALVAVIGPLDASVARSEIPVANASGLALISPATSSPCLTKDLYLPAGLNPNRTAISCQEAGLPASSDLRPSHVNNFFRLATVDWLQGPAAADYAFKTLHVLRAAVLSDGEAYGQALADAFTARFQKLGGSVVGDLDVDPTSTGTVTAFLKLMRADGATAVFVGGAAVRGGCSIRALMAGIFDSGEATPYLGGDGIAEDPACIEAAGANTAGIYATVPSADAGTLASATRAIAAFKTAFGNPSDYGPFTMAAYDAAAVLYSALDRAIRASGGRQPERGNVISQLSVTSGFAGTTGTIGFDPAGDNTSRIVSIYEPTSSDPRAPWKLVDAVDYSAALPY